MRVALLAAVIFALFHAMSAPQAAQPLSGERVLGSQLRLSSRLIAELDKQPAHRDPNVVISPASIAGVMSLLGIGADAKMRGAIFNTLGLTPGLGHEPAADLAALRATMAKAAMKAKQDEANVTLANAVVFEPKAKPYDKAVARMRAAGADVSVTSLSDLATVKHVNDWVSAKTNRLIPAILEERPLPPGLVAINALYFKGLWPAAFAKDRTRPQTFHAIESDLDVPMMSTTASFNFKREGRFAAVEMSYRGGRYALVLVTTTDHSAKADEFTGVTDWIGGGAGFARRQVRLSLPRFTLEAGQELLDPLKALGLKDGMDSPTAFEGLSMLPLEISGIVQKTYLRVDEEGTEAAATTGVGIALQSVQRPEPVETLVVDHPFLFGLRDTRTGLLLMSGYIGRPAAGPAANLDVGPAKKRAALKN